jgi:hypothetical protein
VRRAAHKYQSYQARADRDGAKALAATDSPFTIEIRFLGGLTATQQAASEPLRTGGRRSSLATCPTSSSMGSLVDDVVILAQGKAIDGAGKILGRAGPSLAHCLRRDVPLLLR